jgi:hypothetical protein
MRKRIEASPLFDGQAAGKPPMHFPPCLMTHFDTKSFEHHRTWKNDPALPALLQDEGGQMNQALVLNGSRQQPCRQFGGGTPSKWTKLQFVAKLSGMGLAVPISWLRVSSITKMPQIDHGVGHQLHTVMALLFELKAQQQPFEFILPREGPLHA